MAAPMTAPPALAVAGISKVFQRPRMPPIEALRDITLSVAEGEFVSIVGASGSGKSTLLRIIDGLLPASSGVVHVAGTAVMRPGRDRAMVVPARRVAAVAHRHGQTSPMVFASTAPSDVRRRRSRNASSIWPGLHGFEGHYPHQLSGGMRQRVNVARALAVNPRILLLDEPFAALDAQTREVMQAELLRIWQQSGTTVLLITHQIDEAIYLSDRVVVFSARPGTVREEIPIDLPRPRLLDVKRTAGFAALVDRIWRLIEHEVQHAAANNE